MQPEKLGMVVDGVMKVVGGFDSVEVQAVANAV
jgi:hypothetical protein